MDISLFYFTEYSSPIGRIRVAVNNTCDKITVLSLEGQRLFLSTGKAAMCGRNDVPLLDGVCAWLDEYFAGKNPCIDSLPLQPEGTDFRRTVWELLLKIPYGETATYGEIAKMTALRLCKNKMSAQAVGGAVGHNPISIIIPCHRVVGAGGALTGYNGGIEQKIKLLKLEHADLSQLHI